MNLEIEKVAEKILHIGELDVVNKIHSKNYDVLNEHLSKYFELKSVLPGNLISNSYDAHIETWAYMNTLQQHISNYLSSASSLIDLTRKHYNRYYKEAGKLTEYETQINERFIDSMLHSFVKDFRNYVLHYGVPPLSTTKSISYVNNNEVTHRIEIIKKDLMESSFNWTKKSKDFFNSDQWEEHRHIKDLFTSYYTKLNEFQNWYANEQRNLYNEEFKLINASNIEFQKELISKIVNHIKSGNGYTLNGVEKHMLRCFTKEEAFEILKIENQKERFIEMIQRLDSCEAITKDSYGILFLLTIQ